MQSVTRSDQSMTFRQHVRRFFYSDEVPYGLALVRMFLPLALLVPMIPRWPHARELYSIDGASTPLWNSYGWPNMLPEVPGTVAVILMTLLIVSLVTASLGWRTRTSLGISFVLYTYLTLLDAISTMTKYSVIASHVLLLLSLSNCGAVWSVDRWLRNRRLRSAGLSPPFLFNPVRSAAWPRRLLQLLIGYVYFGAAVTKLHTPAYFSGEQLLSWMRTNVNYDNSFGEYLTLFPVALVFCAYVTVVWEILFVFLSWRGISRAIMLVMGVVFHVMTALTLGLYVFPMVCISAYFAFMNENDVRRISLLWRRWRQRLIGHGRLPIRDRFLPTRWRLPERLPVPSGMAFLFAAAIAVIIGVEVEYWMDPYGLRRPEGRYALKELDPVYVEKELLTPSKPLDPRDIVDHLDTGTIHLGGFLLDSRKDFHHGEILKAQAKLNSPHEDMWLECTLYDDQQREVATRMEPVVRELERISFPFPLTEALEPGTYYLVLKSKGRKLMRRTIHLHPREDRRAAN